MGDVILKKLENLGYKKYSNPSKIQEMINLLEDDCNWVKFGSVFVPEYKGTQMAAAPDYFLMKTEEVTKNLEKSIGFADYTVYSSQSIDGMIKALNNQEFFVVPSDAGSIKNDKRKYRFDIFSSRSLN